MIPRFKPYLGVAELTALFRRNAGAVERFEKAFAKAFGATDAVAFPYGRSALWAFLHAVGVRDAEVVMPAYTCSVVAHAITLSGNRPRFVDIRLSDYNMDLELLPYSINGNTRAIVATHLFGYPLDLDRLETIVAEAEAQYGNKIWLIQDCAHAFGATWKGRLVGTSGDVGLYALNISKMMTAIFGGMLTFQDAALADRIRAWRDQHFRKAPMAKAFLRRAYLIAIYLAFNRFVYGLTWWLQEKTPLLNRFTKLYHLDHHIHFPPDYQERMLDVEAAVGLCQLDKYPEIIARRRENAAWFAEHIESKVGWASPPLFEGATYSHFVLRVPDRSRCIAELAQQGIHLGNLIQYSVPTFGAYREAGFSAENSNLASQHTINLPVYAGLREQERMKIASALK